MKTKWNRFDFDNREVSRVENHYMVKYYNPYASGPAWRVLRDAEVVTNYIKDQCKLRIEELKTNPPNVFEFRGEVFRVPKFKFSIKPTSDTVNEECISSEEREAASLEKKEDNTFLRTRSIWIRIVEQILNLLRRLETYEERKNTPSKHLKNVIISLEGYINAKTEKNTTKK